MVRLAVAAVSARLLAETAARDGFDVVALDLFGDADTRRAASHWTSIGNPADLRIDPERLLAALQRLARSGSVEGWVAGSGFECQPELLAAGAALLPLIGTTPDAVTAVRDPGRFFGVLDDQGIAHPPVQWQLPVNGSGWLVKDARACGGGHVRRLAATGASALPPHHYVQREHRGSPMSATFVANGHDARVLGFNQQMVRGDAVFPYAYRGVLGPVTLPPAVSAAVTHVVSVVTRSFALCGVCGLDFLFDGGQAAVLEVNPRPPASMALYAGLAPMSAHWAACRHGELPAGQAPVHGAPVHGSEIVFAHRALALGNEVLALLAAWPGVHDVPCEAGVVPGGHPLCSLSAEGGDATEVRAMLASRRDALTKSLEIAA